MRYERRRRYISIDRGARVLRRRCAAFQLPSPAFRRILWDELVAVRSEIIFKCAGILRLMYLFIYLKNLKKPNIGKRGVRERE